MNNRTRKAKKHRKLKIFMFLFILLLLFVVAYCIYQYRQGLAEASDGKYKNDGETFDTFQGPEPQIGEINILLLGSDSRGEEHARSDTLMIAHYNQNSNKLKIASIMRDTYVDIPGHGKQKINAAFAFGGPELVRKTIKQNFDIDANYYAVIDFEGFSKMADIIAPDGIEVNIPYEMSYGIGMTLHPGKQILHGKQMLGYVRFRHDKLSDFGRVERQQEVLSKLKNEALTLHSLVKLPKLIGVADPYIDTNIDKRTILSIAKGLFVGKSNKMDTLRIPLQNAYVDDNVDVGAVLKIDIEKNKQALHEFLSTNN